VSHDPSEIRFGNADLVQTEQVFVETVMHVLGFLWWTKSKKKNCIYL